MHLLKVPLGAVHWDAAAIVHSLENRKGLWEFTELRELTPGIVNTLIQRIEVHNRDRSTGKKHVTIGISFTAVGSFAIPDEKKLRKLLDDIRENPQDTGFRHKKGMVQPRKGLHHS